MTLQRVLFQADGYSLPPYTFARSSSAYETSAAGVLQLRSTDQLRIDWLDLDNDGERETPSVVVEQARANLLSQGRDFSASTWATSNVSVDPNVGVAADGSKSGDMVYPSTLANTHYVYQDNIGVPGSTDHALSVYASPGGLNFLSVELINSAGTNLGRAHFELTSSGAVVDTGTFGAGEHRRSYIERLRAGVYRCTLVASISTSTSAQVRYYPAQTSSQMASVWTGGGSSGGLGVLLWGAQLESAMPVATSLVLTGSTGAGTGDEDTLYLPFPHSPRAMTLFLEQVEAGGIFRAASVPLHLGDANVVVDPRFVIDNAGSAYRLTYDNGLVSQTATLAAAPALGDRFRLRAVLYEDGTILLGQEIEGSTETVTARSTSSMSLPSSWANDTLYINSGGNSNHGLNRTLSVKVAEGEQSMEYMRSLDPFFVIDGIAVPVAQNSVRENRQEIGDRARAFDGTMRETIRSRVSSWEAETVQLTVADRNTIVQALESSTQPQTAYGHMARNSTGGVPNVFTRVTAERLVQSGTERRFVVSMTAEQSS